MAMNLEKFEDSPHLVDILIQMEDVLDSLDLYCFRNWFEGEIVEGPVVKRHWLSFSLLYPYSKMPDPRAIRRLHKHGVRVTFSKVKRSENEHAEDEAQDLKREAKDADEDDHDNLFWLVKIVFPRRLVGEITDSAEIEEYEDEVDVEDVEDAQNAGMNDESGYVDDDAATQVDPDDVEQQDVEQGGGRAI